MNELKYIYLLIEKCRQKSNVLFVLACIVEHWLWLLLSEVWSSNDAVCRYLCSHRDGRECSWGFLWVSRAGWYTKGGSRGGGYFFYILFVNKEEGNLPARRTLTHILSPARSFFFCYISLTSFLSLKEFSEFCQFDVRDYIEEKNLMA